MPTRLHCPYVKEFRGNSQQKKPEGTYSFKHGFLGMSRWAFNLDEWASQLASVHPGRPCLFAGVPRKSLTIVGIAVKIAVSLGIKGRTRTRLCVAVPCRPFHAQMASLLLAGVGYFSCLFVLDVALVVARDLNVAEYGIRLSLCIAVHDRSHRAPILVCCSPETVISRDTSSALLHGAMHVWYHL